MPLLPRDIKEMLDPFRMIVKRNALSPMYRSLLLDTDHVRAASQFGILQMRMSFGHAVPICVDALTFMALIDSLPADSEFILKPEATALAWECGHASGRVALIAVDNMPTLTRKPKAGWRIVDGFDDSIRLGALSCSAIGLARGGSYGVVLDSRGEGVRIMSSDSITLSDCVFPHKMLGAQPIITLAPDAAMLLAEVVQPQGNLEFDDDGMYYTDDNTRLLIKHIPPFKHDLGGILAQFEAKTISAPIPLDRIAAFIKRVGVLTEAKKSATVTLRAADDTLGLVFSEDAAMSDEYFLVQGLKIGAEPLEIKLDANRLARALVHVDRVILDHVRREDKGMSAVVFAGTNPEFYYYVAGVS